MMSLGNVCKMVATLNDSIEATYLIEKDTVTQWAIKPYTNLPPVDRMQTMMIQRALLFSLASAHQDLLGTVNHIQITYDDCDVYLFEVNMKNSVSHAGMEKGTGPEEDLDDINRPKILLPIFEKNILVVRVKRPYSQDNLVSNISRILNIS